VNWEQSPSGFESLTDVKAEEARVKKADETFISFNPYDQGGRLWSVR